MTTDSGTAFELPSETHIARVALDVGSRDGMRSFYRDVLGFDAERDGKRVRLSAGGETLIVLEEDPALPERRPDEAGLFHVAVRVPDRPALADVLARIRRSDVTLSGASDHLVSEALYLRDPEGNGIEVYRDRPRTEWTETDDGVEMATLPLDLDDLLSEASERSTLPSRTDIGHVHLEVTDRARSEAFYVDTLGFRIRARYGDEAAFLAAGDYHHHVGINTWNHRRSSAGSSRGLRRIEFALPSGETVDAVTGRLREAGFEPDAVDGGLAVSDPDGIRIRFVAEE